VHAKRRQECRAGERRPRELALANFTVRGVREGDGNQSAGAIAKSTSPAIPTRNNTDRIDTAIPRRGNYALGESGIARRRAAG